MASCELCGSRVNVHGDVGVCVGCGSEYDVIRHGRGSRDFSKSVEVAIGARQLPTDAKIYLGPSPMGPGVVPFPPGTVKVVGTPITVRMGIYSTEEGKFISPSPQNVTLWHRLGTGAWEKLWVGGWAAADTFDFTYTLPAAGTHTFYIEWPGTSVYAGCEVVAEGLNVADYSTSPEVSVEALPALTVTVKDMIFKKPIEGAKVVIDMNEALTDASGMAIFDALAPGTYALSVSARDYKSKTRTVDLTSAGMVVEVGLWHIGAIALGLVGGASVGLIVAHKALKRG